MSQAGNESNRPGSRDGLVPAVATTISAVATAAAVVLTTLIVALILRAADHVSAKAAKASTDGGTFQATAALVSDDAARSGTAEGAEYRTGLGVGAAATGNEADRESSQQGAKGCFHKMVQGFKVGGLEKEPRDRNATGTRDWTIKCYPPSTIKFTISCAVKRPDGRSKTYAGGPIRLTANQTLHWRRLQPLPHPSI